LQIVIDRGYDPLAYRFFNMSAHYRAKLNFTWDGLDSAATTLDRLRNAVYEWGAPGNVDDGYADRFTAEINEDLNMPRALAVTWDLVRSNLPDATKKATILLFDRVLGLQLAEWQPLKEEIPNEILALAQQRQVARSEKRWAEADAFRLQITQAGYEVEDTPQGPRIKTRK
jgi:cysteinyl-tRNA synthetase